MENESIYSELHNFKNLERTGWKQHHIEGRLESIAEHSYSMAMLAVRYMDTHPNNLDQLKVLKMILFHDLGELDAGDITPLDGIPREEQRSRELKGIKRLSATYNMPEIESLWQEFKEQKTPEAKFVRMIDKLDAVKQAKEYSERQNRPEVFTEFYNNAKTIIDPIYDLNL